MIDTRVSGFYIFLDTFMLPAASEEIIVGGINTSRRAAANFTAALRYVISMYPPQIQGTTSTAKATPHKSQEEHEEDFCRIARHKNV